MKKLLYFLFLFLFIIPVVNAEESDVILKDLVLKKTEGYTEVLSDAEIVNNKIVLNLKMYEVGDSAEYQFTIQNDTNQDFMADTQNLISQTSTIEYQLIGEDQSNIVEKKSAKKFILTVTYKNEVEKTLFKTGKYKTSSNVVIQFRDPSLINPLTGSIFYSIILTIILITVGFIVIKNSKAKNLLFLLLLIPVSTLAFYEYDVVIDSNIIIGYVTPNPCTYDGELVQGAEYTNGQYTYRYMQEVIGYNSSTYETTWENFEEEGWSVTLTDKESTDSVTSVLCTTINNKPIVSMQDMFVFSKTTSIDTSSFDTSNVTNMRYVFYGCRDLTSIDVTNFDTSKVTKMNCMFEYCSSLTELDLSNFDLSNGTSFESIAGGFLYDTSSLKKINMSNWKLPADMTNAVFGYSYSNSSPIEEIDVTGWDLSRTTNASYMFGKNGSNGKGGTGLKIIKGLDTLDTSNITNMNNMFYGLSSLETLDLSTFDTSNVTDMRYMFRDCSSLIELNLNGFDLTKASSFEIMKYAFENTKSLKRINMSNWKLPSNMDSAIFWVSNASNSPIEEIDVTGWDLSNTTSAYAILQSSGSNGTGGTGLKKIKGLDTWDTSHITNMNSMFNGLSSLTSLDLSSFNTSNVTDMKYMFPGCSSLEELNLSGFDLTNASSFSSIAQGFFGGIQSLKKINMSNWKLPEDMSHAIFRYGAAGSSVEEIDVTGWDLSLTTNAMGMFGYNNTNGTGLKTIKGLDTWDTSHITNMSQMFQGLSSLTTLDLSSFNMNNVTNTDDMFSNCSSLTTGYARSSSDATKLNNSSNKPSGVTFTVKS